MKMMGRAEEGAVVAGQRFTRPDTRTSTDRLDEAHIAVGAAIYPAGAFRSAIRDVAGWDIDLALPRAIRERTPLSVLTVGKEEFISPERGRPAMERWLLQGRTRASSLPLTRDLLQRLSKSDVQPLWLMVFSAVSAALAVAAFLTGWFWPGFVLAALSVFVAPLAQDLARLLSQSARRTIFDWSSPRIMEFGWYVGIAARGAWLDAVATVMLCALIVIDRRMQQIVSMTDISTSPGQFAPTGLRLAVLGLFALPISPTAGLCAAALATAALVLLRQERIFRSKRSDTRL